MFWLVIGLALGAEPLSFAEALSKAGNAPALVALEHARASRGALRRRMSRMTSNPVVQLQPGVRDMRTGGVGGEVYLSLLQRLSTSGLGKKRAHTVDLELASDEVSHALMLRVVRQAVANAWLLRWAAQQALALTQAEVESAHQFERGLERALSAGEATRVDVGQARAFRAELELSVLGQEGRAFEAGVDLSQVLGDIANEPRAVIDRLPQTDVPDMPAELDAGALERVPRVAAARAVAGAERARLEEVKASRAPYVAIGAMGWREGGGDVAAVATLEMEIGGFDHGEREQSSQAAHLALAEGAVTEAAVEASAERARRVHEVEHTAAVQASYERGLIAALEQVATAQQARLEAREGTVLEWVIARRALLDARVRAVEAQAASALARFLANEWFASAQENRP